MSMFSPVREGTWWIGSKSDPRWDTSGKAIVGGFFMNPEARQAINELTNLYGDPPKDLEFGYMKD